jgi:signal transduction histidine kinase
MRPLPLRRLRRLAVPALAACSFAVAAAPASAASPCTASATSARTTTLCLINAERAAHGARPLKLEKRLSRAALRHSRDMVANRYFAHDSRSGAGFSARIARTGWMQGRSRWNVGENLAALDRPGLDAQRGPPPQHAAAALPRHRHRHRRRRADRQRLRQDLHDGLRRLSYSRSGASTNNSTE